MDESVIKQIKPEITNMNEVKALLGPPAAISHSSTGDTNWVYFYGRSMFYKSEGHGLVIIFRNGVVSEVSYGGGQITRVGPLNWRYTADEGKEDWVKQKTTAQPPQPVKPHYAK